MDKKTNIELPNVSIVVIGHNEARNLDNCFSALINLNYPKDKIEIIYVDSKSSDNSIEIARKYTDKIFYENSYWPTAGEAFNRGIVESTSEFIHITGGDIQLNKDYLTQAINTLLERTDVHCVTGFFTEKNMKGWNKILAYRREYDRNTNDHFVQTPNGGTFKKEAFLIVNGYDERIKKGQETELGSRFKDNGLKIWFLNIPQGIHDFELNTTADMIDRNYRNGFSMGHLLLLSMKEKGNKNLILFKKAAIKNLIINSFFLGILIILICIGGPLFSLIWIAIYLFYYPFRVLLGFRKGTLNYKLLSIMTGYFSIFSFFGMFGFLIYYLKLKNKGIQLIKPRVGLKLKKG